jgi:hypothetical protein
MSVEKLRSYSKQVLTEMARKSKIPGWHAMRKEQLVKALSAPRNSTSRNGTHRNDSHRNGSLRNGAHRNGTKRDATRSRLARAALAKRSVARAAAHSAALELASAKNIARGSSKGLPHGYTKDRIVVMVRDPYWLHAYWEITRAAVERAEAALRQDWHGAKPVLRVLDVSAEDTTSSAERHVRDIEIHGGVSNWYLDVSDPPHSYRIDIGYLGRNGRFYAVARSNVVTTPRAGVSDTVDENWVSVQEQFEKIYAMSGGYDGGSSSLELKQLFEERLRRPMGSGAVTSFGAGAMQKERKRKFWFKVDAELIVYGASDPNAHVMLQGEPVQLRPDGTFTMRFALPDKRQIIPVTASSADGIEERTIVLAVERNTKELEPMVHETSDE